MKLLLAIISLSLITFAVNASETVKGVKKDYQSFKQEMNMQLEQAEQSLEVLKAKGEDHLNSAQKATLAELQATKEKLKSKLDSMVQESVKTSRKVKADLASSISSLNERIQKALKD